MKRDLTPGEARAEAIRRWPDLKDRIAVRRGDGPPKDKGRAWRKLIGERNRRRRETSTAADWAAFEQQELDRWMRSAVEQRCEVLINRGWCNEVRVWGPTFREGFERVDRQREKDRVEGERRRKLHQQRLDALAKARAAKAARRAGTVAGIVEDALSPEGIARTAAEHAEGDARFGRDWLTGGCTCGACRIVRQQKSGVESSGRSS